MNTNYQEALKLVSEIRDMVNDEVTAEVGVIIAPPFVHLTRVAQLLGKESKIVMGAQNCYSETAGAYTGEISATMLKAIDVRYVIVGHSERRIHFGEDNAFLKRKIDACLGQGLIPIYCCGETLDERNASEHFDVVSRQLSEALYHLDESQIRNIVLAYEPVWAIGTGLTATADQAQEMHSHIRKSLAARYSEEAAEAITLLYGGSCNSKNARELFACKDVDGGLIGSASLKSREFVDIIKSF